MRKTNNVIKEKCRNRHKYMRYFKQYSFEEIITIPQQKPNIEDVVSIMADPEIVSIRVINTPKGNHMKDRALRERRYPLK